MFSDSAFKQQRLPAWQPILTAGTVLPTFFIIGVAFIPIGIGLLHFSNNVRSFFIHFILIHQITNINPLFQVKEFVHDYTDCVSMNGSTAGRPCAEVLQENFKNGNFDVDCVCKVDVYLPETFDVRIK